MKNVLPLPEKIPALEGVRVLVTGAAGFIGSHLTRALVEAGARVRALDNLASGSLGRLRGLLSRIEFRRYDLRSLADCRAVCRGVDLVFHQAALGSVTRSLEDPATTFAVNVLGTANLLAMAHEARVRRFVYASSSGVYGDSRRLPKREGEEGRPRSPYALSKRMNEEMAAVFHACFGLQTIGLRYFNVYGPGQDAEGAHAAVIPRFFKACLEDSAPVIYGDGKQSRDFIFVEDAVAANLAAAAAPRSACGSVYNIGGGSRTTVAELARRVREAADRGKEPVQAPPRKGDVRHSLADLTRAREVLGWAPRWDLPRGLALSRQHFATCLGSSPLKPAEPLASFGGPRPGEKLT